MCLIFTTFSIKKFFTKLDSNMDDVGSRINFQFKMKLNLTKNYWSMKNPQKRPIISRISYLSSIKKTCMKIPAKEDLRIQYTVHFSLINNYSVHVLHVAGIWTCQWVSSISNDHLQIYKKKLDLLYYIVKLRQGIGILFLFPLGHSDFYSPSC